MVKKLMYNLPIVPIHVRRSQNLDDNSTHSFSPIHSLTIPGKSKSVTNRQYDINSFLRCGKCYEFCNVQCGKALCACGSTEG